jgi:outer membrane protein assembly factor BamB
LPDTFPEAPRVLWELSLAQSGLGGIAANESFVIFGDRSFDNLQDVFRCVDANSGAVVWEVARFAAGKLDYGNSPRATPLIAGPHVYCLGAFGTLLCIELESGNVVWETSLRRYKTQGDLPWGFCGSPLLVDGKLILNPGGPEASVVALDALTGAEVWRSPGGAPSHGSFIEATIRGKRQAIGYDANTLGGWDIDTGERLWTIIPKVPGDFNVPTPIVYGNQLLVVTENNGLRLFDFDAAGKAVEQPMAQNAKFRPSMSTPVVVGDRLFCVNNFLYCFDIREGLKELWRRRDSSLGEYAAVVASNERLMVVGQGELLLLGTDGSKNIESRLRIFPEDVPLYSHPAIVGNRVYVRGESRLICIEL